MRRQFFLPVAFLLAGLFLTAPACTVTEREERVDRPVETQSGAGKAAAAPQDKSGRGKMLERMMKQMEREEEEAEQIPEEEEEELAPEER